MDENSAMAAQRFGNGYPGWDRYLAHLERVEMTTHAVDEDGEPIEGNYYLSITDDDAVIGHISIKVQKLIVPETEWSSVFDHHVRDTDGAPLRETFVQTFAVESNHRRKGHGRALQLAALDLTCDLGCYQMRSWSSLDARANYRLKLSLGFAIHPATYTTDTGLQVSGAYFVRTTEATG